MARLSDVHVNVLTDGCPGLCNNNGRCVLDQNVWHCICQSGWRGLGCDVATETLCSDGKDNEGGRSTRKNKKDEEEEEEEAWYK